jgi:hypothetical protein
MLQTPVDYLRGVIWELLTKLLVAQVWAVSVGDFPVSLEPFSTLAQGLVEMAVRRMTV